MATKESNLITVDSLTLNDRFRILQQNLSRNISYQDLINDINGRLTDAEQSNFVRTTTVSTVVDFDDDQIILVNAAFNDVTVTLPDAADAWDNTFNISKSYMVKRIDNSANTVRVAPQGVATIDTQADVLLSAFAYIRVFTDGANWWLEA